jgi:hypothetical protein
MKRICASVVAILLIFAGILGGATVLSPGTRANDTPGPYASPSFGQVILGPIDASKYKGVKGGAVACPNHQPCGETSQP